MLSQKKITQNAFAKKNLANNIILKYRYLIKFTQQNQVSKVAFIIKKIVFLLPLLALLSCYQGKFDAFDRQTGLSRSEINDTFIRNRVKEKQENATIIKSNKKSSIPKISKLIIPPPPPTIGGDKTISFSVTDQIPLKDVLIELGRVAKIDIDIDSNITGGIILNARNKPLKEVIDRIATLGKLRYSYVDGVLFFELDTPQMKNYFVDYLTDGTLWTDVETNISSLLTQSSDFSDSSFSSNKSAGIISIFATSRQHEIIKNYLKAVEKTASSQVLIEAKVVEVSLTDTYKTGIDWSFTAGRTTGVISGAYESGQPLSLVFSGLYSGDLTTSISALETFGQTKTLSSPRIHAINNQKATLNFADKLVYFKIDSSQETTSSTSAINTSTITSSKEEEDVGVQLEITPSINVETGEIVMKIHPTLSVKSSEVVDPASPTDDDGNIIVENRVPVIQTREIETIAKIQSGNVIVIGGLMKENTTNNESGIPFVSRIPLLGWLFKSVSKDTNVVETVIFIKATLVKSSTPASTIDRDIQDKFDTNRRKYF